MVLFLGLILLKHLQTKSRLALLCIQDNLFAVHTGQHRRDSHRPGRRKGGVGEEEVWMGVAGRVIAFNIG